MRGPKKRKLFFGRSLTSFGFEPPESISSAPSLKRTRVVRHTARQIKACCRGPPCGIGCRLNRERAFHSQPSTSKVQASFRPEPTERATFRLWRCTDVSCVRKSCRRERRQIVSLPQLGRRSTRIEFMRTRSFSWMTTGNARKRRSTTPAGSDERSFVSYLSVPLAQVTIQDDGSTLSPSLFGGERLAV